MPTNHSFGSAYPYPLLERNHPNTASWLSTLRRETRGIQLNLNVPTNRYWQFYSQILQRLSFVLPEYRSFDEFKQNIGNDFALNMQSLYPRYWNKSAFKYAFHIHAINFFINQKHSFESSTSNFVPQACFLTPYISSYSRILVSHRFHGRYVIGLGETFINELNDAYNSSNWVAYWNLIYSIVLQMYQRTSRLSRQRHEMWINSTNNNPAAPTTAPRTIREYDKTTSRLAQEYSARTNKSFHVSNNELARLVEKLTLSPEILQEILDDIETNTQNSMISS